MVENSFKSTVTKSIIWSGVEKISIQFFQVLIGIILARLLIPKDFGLIGAISIFMVVSQTFIESGFGSALVQKQNRNNIDFSIVFWFNLVVSAVLYILLFYSSSLIANFYEINELSLIIKVLGFNLLINALAIVQKTKVLIRLDFKTFTKINLISILFSGVISIYLAYLGFGVWSLVFKQLTYSLVNVILLWVFNKNWLPLFYFSKKSFKELYSFGSKLLLANISSNILQNLYNVIIGKVYSVNSLGFYTQAKIYPELTSNTIANIISQVSFPVLSSLQNDKHKMLNFFTKMLRLIAFISFPLMFYLAIIAEPFVILVLGKQWLLSVPFLQYMCFSKVLTPLMSININLINAKGRSDLFLKADLIIGIIVIITLIVTSFISIKAMVISHIFTSLIGFLIYTHFSNKLFGFGFKKQIKELSLIFIISIISSVISFLVVQNLTNLNMKLILATITMLVSYISISFILKISELNELLLILKKIKKHE